MYTSPLPAESLKANDPILCTSSFFLKLNILVTPLRYVRLHYSLANRLARRAYALSWQTIIDLPSVLSYYNRLGSSNRIRQVHIRYIYNYVALRNLSLCSWKATAFSWKMNRIGASENTSSFFYKCNNWIDLWLKRRRNKHKTTWSSQLHG